MATSTAYAKPRQPFAKDSKPKRWKRKLKCDAHRRDALTFPNRRGLDPSAETTS
jgi:hypothetical protein